MAKAREEGKGEKSEEWEQGLRVSGGYPVSWLVSPSKGHSLLCGLCHAVCRDLVELGCDVHETDDNEDEGEEVSLRFCQPCLKGHLLTHDGQCPLTRKEKEGTQTHTHACKYQKVVSLRKQVLKLEVRCPNGLMPVEGEDKEEQGKDKSEVASEMCRGCEWRGKLKVSSKFHTLFTFLSLPSLCLCSILVCVSVCVSQGSGDARE